MNKLMNYKQRLIIIAFLIFSIRAFSQQLNSYEVTGHLKGLKEGEKVTMQLSTFRWPQSDNFSDCLKRMDSAYVKNGSFHISGIVPDGPRMYWLEFDQHISTNYNSAEKRLPRSLTLFIDNGEKIAISSDVDISDINHGDITHYVTIEGSLTNNSYLHLIPADFFYYQCMARLNGLERKIRDSIGFNEPLLDGIYAMRNEINQAFYYSFFERVNIDVSTANLWLIQEFHYSGNDSIWRHFYNNLDDRLKRSFMGKCLNEYTTLCVGQPFPLFTLPESDGKMLALKDVISKSKLTIVHFWAEQSYNREKMQDELKVLYKKYHQKGLNIVGVSSDQYKDQWKNGLKKYQLPWYNVSDLKGKDGVVDKIYHEYGTDPFIRNTTNYLIDEYGKILAYDVMDIRLQWYLKKAFGE